MVDTQIRPSDVTKFPIIKAMLSVPREVFVPEERREAAYVGENLPLAAGRVVLEPRTLAKILDALNIGPNEMVLDIGAGFGYCTAVIAQMAEAVVAVEEDAGLAREAQALLAEHGGDNIVVETGPLSEGAAAHAPYDVILIEGGIEVLPEAIGEQLREGGRIACLFMEGDLGVVRIGHKAGGVITWRFAFNASAPVIAGFEEAASFAL